MNSRIEKPTYFITTDQTNNEFTILNQEGLVVQTIATLDDKGEAEINYADTFFHFLGQELLLITLGEVWITRYSNFDKTPEEYLRVDKEYTDQIIYYNWYGSSTKQSDIAIFITGGIDDRDNALMSSAVKYDNETDKWSHL